MHIILHCIIVNDRTPHCANFLRCACDRTRTVGLIFKIIYKIQNCQKDYHYCITPTSCHSSTYLSIRMYYLVKISLLTTLLCTWTILLLHWIHVRSPYSLYTSCTKKFLKQLMFAYVVVTVCVLHMYVKYRTYYFISNHVRI